MDGKSLTRRLYSILQESSSSTFATDRESYDYLYDAVQDFNFKTHFLTDTQTISVVAGTSSYDLDPSFVDLSLEDSYNRKFIKHTYGGNDTFLVGRDYASIIMENNSSTAAIADSFAIINSTDKGSLAGTATLAGTASNGECVLTDSTAPFANVSIGDAVYNTSDNSDGVVIDITSSSQIVCALFNGTTNQWTLNDDYVITLQPRLSVYLTPEPAASATLTIPYIKRPGPVYSPYRSYQLPFSYELPIVQYAAFLYKYKDREANFGDALFKHYDVLVRKIAAEMRRSKQNTGMRVNFSKMDKRSRSIGNYSR